MRALNDGAHAGVLLHGMGQLGKSSLAARVANRLGHHRTVVIFEDYRAVAIFDAVAKALPGDLRPVLTDIWRPQIIDNESRLYDGLRALLEGPLADERTALPVLLVIDDFEQVLETPQPGEDDAAMKADHVPAMAATIAAFRDSMGWTDSRLLLTSRYRFVLVDPDGNDLAAALHDIQLAPMNASERQKQLMTAAGIAGFAAPEDEDDAQQVAGLMERATAAASGNPGLQTILTSPLLRLGDFDATEAATAAVESYLQTGRIPRDGSAADFFTRISFEIYKAALTADEALQMRAALICDLPMPLTVHALAGRSMGIGDSERAVKRLLGLGLLDPYVAASEKPAAGVNGLAKPLFAPLTQEERKHLATVVVSPLMREWRDGDGDLPAGPRAVALADLAFLAEAEASIVNRAALPAAGYFFRTLHSADRALEIIVCAVKALEKVNGDPDLHLLRIGNDCAERIGNTELQDLLLETGLAIDAPDAGARAKLEVSYAGRLWRKGDPELAVIHLANAIAIFEKLGDVRSLAVTKGKIADILEARGDLDAALRIRTEEQLPAFEKLGDLRSLVVTRGEIADILEARGDLDAALRIRTEEQLPAYEKLGDVRSLVVTRGKIADILQARGDLDAALRIRTEEELPTYEKLGDVHELAITKGKIADILEARADLDAARQLHLANLAVAERMGAVQITMDAKFSIARIGMAEGISSTEDAQLVVKYLFDAYTIAQGLQRPDAIAAIGREVLQMLELTEAISEAQAVAEDVAAALEKLGQKEEADALRSQAARLRSDEA